MQEVIKLNQRVWLKPYIDMSTNLWKSTENDFEIDFFQLMNNSVFGKSTENVRQHRDIKLVTTEIRRKCLVSEPNYYTTKWFSKNILAIEMKKSTKVLMKKPVCLGPPILDIKERTLSM